jgi:hypothetical protein
MINKYVAMGLGALIALAPVPAVAQEVAQAAPAATPDTSMASPTTGHTGSHRGHVRRKGNTAGHRARASAHHMHKMRTAPAAPAEAPKS